MSLQKRTPLAQGRAGCAFVWRDYSTGTMPGPAAGVEDASGGAVSGVESGVGWAWGVSAGAGVGAGSGVSTGVSVGAGSGVSAGVDVGSPLGVAEGDVPGVADGVASGVGVVVTGVRVFRPVEVSMPSRAASAGL